MRRACLNKEVTEMQKTRAEVQFDRPTETSPTAYRTATNRHEFRCSMCGGAVFVDGATRKRVERAVEEGLEDNPLICPDCETDSEDERAAA